MSSSKISIFLYKKLKVKKYLLSMFDFFSFFVFFPLFSIVLFCLLLNQTIFRWIGLFWEDFFFRFQVEHYAVLEKTQFQIIVFYKKAALKISRIFSSNSAPRNLVKFRKEFFLGNISRILC